MRKANVRVVFRVTGLTLDEFENGFEDFLNSFDSSGFVTEQGDIEDWHVKALDKQKIRETVLKNLQEARVELNK